MLCFTSYRYLELNSRHSTENIASVHYATNRKLNQFSNIPLFLSRNNIFFLYEWQNYATFLLHYCCCWVTLMNVILVLVRFLASSSETSSLWSFFSVPWLVVRDLGQIRLFHRQTFASTVLLYSWGCYKLFHALHVTFGITCIATSRIHLSKV